MQQEFRDAIEQFSGLYCVIRTINSGVHVGVVMQLIPNEGQGWMCILHESRRIRDWKGAFTLSELSQLGFEDEGTRLSVTVPKHGILDAIEVIPCSEVVEKRLRNKPAWTP